MQLLQEGEAVNGSGKRKRRVMDPFVDRRGLQTDEGTILGDEMRR